jgi:nifR3 family TIM-barrel protein
MLETQIVRPGPLTQAGFFFIQFSMTIPFHGFWKDLKKPIIGLAPMDGVTDYSFREIIARHGRPDVMFTEFTHTKGLFYAPARILQAFEFSERQRPIVAQIYGYDPDDFYRATHVVCALGFDGIDINMGCPSKKVTRQNCGARLITVPELALGIIDATKRAIHDWAGGQGLEDIGIPRRVIKVLEEMNVRRSGRAEIPVRKIIPYSVKTRIGFDHEVIESWVTQLLTAKPALISIHGRTLKQMYRGQADWSAIAKAVQCAKGSGTMIFGNGDILSMEMARQKISQSGVDGVLVGRKSLGNPWIFRGREHIGRAERFALAREHLTCLRQSRGDSRVHQIKKHLAGYLKDFPNATEIRTRALRSQDWQELGTLLDTS